MSFLKFKSLVLFIKIVVKLLLLRPSTNKTIKRIKLHWLSIIRDQGRVVQSPIKPTQEFREF